MVKYARRKKSYCLPFGAVVIIDLILGSRVATTRKVTPVKGVITQTAVRFSVNQRTVNFNTAAYTLIAVEGSFIPLLRYFNIS